MQILKLGAFVATCLIVTPTAAQQTEIGYDDGSLGFAAMMDGKWHQAERQLLASGDKLGDDPARLLQLAQIYAITERGEEADRLYRQVLEGEDMVLVLADGRKVSAHNIASSRLATQMRAER